MSNPGLGLDFLGAKPWSAKIVPGRRRNERPEAFQSGLPTALLPLQRSEKPPTGKLADEHRRGRALAWPPEAQVPPLGNAVNGSGRVPISALFEMLCAGEKEWGKLIELPVAWRPDGSTEVSLSPSKLIAQQVDAFITPDQWIGLVVPDALGVGGQQALLTAIRSSNLVLVPRSIAAVIGHCRCNSETLPRGHITVVDTSFGAWAVAKIPVDSRVGPDDESWNVPVSDSRLRRNKLSPTGWGMLRKALRTPLAQTLTAGWASDALAGKAKLSSSSTEVFLRLEEASYSWQSSLVGESSLPKALAKIEQASDAILCESPYKRNLGLMVIGPMAAARFDGISVEHLLEARLGEELIASSEESIAAGAAWAAAGAANDWPTWLEQMESLELYYVGADSRGNRTNLWKEVLPEQLIDAGKDYRNPNPIGGLKLAAGADIIRLILKRPKGGGTQEWTYRQVSTKPGTRQKADIPLEVNVRARPGQGFATVTVASKTPGLFESLLDWQGMLACDVPKEQPRGCPDRAVQLKAAPELWRNCQSDLIQLQKWLDKDEPADSITDACKDAVKRLNKALSSENYRAGYGVNVPKDEFVLYTPMGREAKPPGVYRTDGEVLLARIAVSMLKWIRLNPYERQPIVWIKKTAGWWYLGCPMGFVDEAIEDITSPHPAVDEVSLHIAGMCMSEPQQFLDFFEAFRGKMIGSSAPNNWMKALRNLIKFNEKTLHEIDDEQAEAMFSMCLNKLSQAYHDERPIITFNSLEALFFLLKYRQRNWAFIPRDSILYAKAKSMAESIRRNTMNPKTKKLAVKFVEFLDWEGNDDGMGGIFEGEGN
jgi:hypothetical protein